MSPASTTGQRPVNTYGAQIFWSTAGLCQATDECFPACLQAKARGSSQQQDGASYCTHVALCSQLLCRIVVQGQQCTQPDETQDQLATKYGNSLPAAARQHAKHECCSCQRQRPRTSTGHSTNSCSSRSAHHQRLANQEPRRHRRCIAHSRSQCHTE